MVNSVVLVGRATKPLAHAEGCGFDLYIGENGKGSTAVTVRVDLTEPKVAALGLDHIKEGSLLGVQGRLVGIYNDLGNLKPHVLAFNIRLLNNKGASMAEQSAGGALNG